MRAKLFAVFLAATLAAFSLSACSTMQVDSFNDGAAIVDVAREGLADTARQLYETGDIDRQAASKVYERLDQVGQYRDVAVAAHQAGNFDAAEDKLGKAREALESVQALVNELEGGQ